MIAITHTCGLKILDSRGNPTVAAEVTLASRARGQAAAPSGASTGARYAIELRGDPKRCGRKGVSNAVRHVNGETAHAVGGLDALDQAALDACCGCCAVTSPPVAKTASHGISLKTCDCRP